MNKYNTKTIKAYVTGDDLGEYTLEELENDYRFMMEVIIYTNDKKMYNLCSEKVKNNYNFVKFVINKFKTDIDFICKVADDFLNNTKNEIISLELMLLMINLINDKDNKFYMVYKLITNSAYDALMLQLQVFKDNFENNKQIIDEIGMGFWLVLDEYSSSEVITNFFAKKMIDEIMYEYINLENELHLNFKNVQSLENVNTILLSIIGKFDKQLMDYVSSNLSLLDNIKKEINVIKRNWNKFNSKIETDRFDMIREYVSQYIDKHDNDCIFDMYEIIFYIGEELGILEQLKKAYGDEDYPDTFDINKRNMNIVDLKHYLNIKRIMLHFLNQRIPKDPDMFWDIEEELKSGGRKY